MNAVVQKPPYEKLIRLLDYLHDLATLRTTVVRDVEKYMRCLWVGDIPEQKGCFTRAWGAEEGTDSEVWIEVQRQPEPSLPAVPACCKDWVDMGSLRDKKNRPHLQRERTKLVKNLEWRKGSDQPEYLPQTECLDDFPEVQKEWESYIEQKWLPWVESHNAWESVQKVYTDLFIFHQDLQQMSEEHELVLALGFLTWKPGTKPPIRRHLLFANASLEFEAKEGRFTVRAHPEGAKLHIEPDVLQDLDDLFSLDLGTIADSLKGAAADPWDRSVVEPALKALVQSISSEGQYEPSLRRGGKEPTKEPVLEYAPALVLRKRSKDAFFAVVKEIRNRVEKGEPIPPLFAALAELPAEPNATQPDHLLLPDHPNDAMSLRDTEIYFPKPFNEEQRCIVEALRSRNLVVVQGPPGTGKSHTIANLICHLLATGQRTLITAKTSRALQVLAGLVPEPLRPLCISLLDGEGDQRTLEASVSGILTKVEGGWDETRQARRAADVRAELEHLRKKKAELECRIREIVRSESNSNSVAEGTYRGTATEIASLVHQRQRDYGDWFTDDVPLEQSCPVTESQLRKLLEGLRVYTEEKKRELNLQWPDELPGSEQFENLVRQEERETDNERQFADSADPTTVSALLDCEDETIEALERAVSHYRNERNSLLASPFPWMPAALREIADGQSVSWQTRLDRTRDAINRIEPFIAQADDNVLEIPQGANPQVLLVHAEKLADHLERGGSLGWGPFRAPLVKQSRRELRGLQWNGRPCRTVQEFIGLRNVLSVWVHCEKAWAYWQPDPSLLREPYRLQLDSLKQRRDALEKALELKKLLAVCRDAVRACPGISEPRWSDDQVLGTLACCCGLALARRRKKRIEEELRRMEQPLDLLARKDDGHPVVRRLLDALRCRDVQEFAQATEQVKNLTMAREALHDTERNLDALRRHMPQLANRLQQTCQDDRWERRIERIRDAWHWSQARRWVTEYIRKDDYPALQSRVKQIEDQIRKCIQDLAEIGAWDFCVRRMRENEEYSQHMKAWRRSMQKLGKGTGKHAPRHRRDAADHLRQCREAVPAWIMPLYRVWDTVTPCPQIFDVIIVDEASQCGPEALQLFYLGKKVIVVGDDKQIRPEAEGVDQNKVEALRKQYLYDFDLASTFQPQESLFDHANTRWSSISLREHFRCVPEVIRFSNEQCYSNRLIPLRQCGPDRLPPLQHVYVSNGYCDERRKGEPVNQPEVEELVTTICELCDQKAYSEKSMGVIVLQGHLQAQLIQNRLLARLGAEEMERRRLLCGDAYSFQGDERDVMFLSLVVALNRTFHPLTKDSHLRRFNVAASRARDQMWLFHSVQPGELNQDDCRRKLLEFFLRSDPQINSRSEERENLERRAKEANRFIEDPPEPYESWFEVDVALILLRKGYRVIPQFEVAGKRIDLVVDGGQHRFAIECDGDRWHGPERYEEDMQRQRQLERCGWAFFRVRQSAFTADPEDALRRLWPQLEQREIYPLSAA